MLSDLLGAVMTGAPRFIDAVGAETVAAFEAMPVTEQLKLICAEWARLPAQEQADYIEALKPKLGLPFIPIRGPQTMARQLHRSERAGIRAARVL